MYHYATVLWTLEKPSMKTHPHFFTVYLRDKTLVVIVQGIWWWILWGRHKGSAVGTDGGRWLLMGNKEDMNWKRFLGGDAIEQNLKGWDYVIWGKEHSGYEEQTHRSSRLGDMYNQIDTTSIFFYTLFFLSLRLINK